MYINWLQGSDRCFPKSIELYLGHSFSKASLFFSIDSLFHDFPASSLSMAYHSTLYTNRTGATLPLVYGDASPHVLDNVHNNLQFWPDSRHKFQCGDNSGADLGFNPSPPTGSAVSRGSRHPQTQSDDPLSWTLNPTECLHIPPSPQEEHRQEYVHTE